MSDTALQRAYNHCLNIAQAHYENFPVASRLLPHRLRRPVSVIYAFARNADDFADEGDTPADERLAQLETYRRNLDGLQRGECAQDPVFIALADVIRIHHLPLQLFYDLLHAFTQDVTKNRYASFREVMDYCRCSANPIGRLILHLIDAPSPENLRDSDAVCSALQLINFLQDLEQDYCENNRIYLPADEMARFAVTDAHFRERRSDAALCSLLDFQIERARALMLAGADLGARLSGRMGFEIRLTVQGGLQMLKALARRDNVFDRPRLRRRDWLSMLWRAALPRR